MSSAERSSSSSELAFPPFVFLAAGLLRGGDFGAFFLVVFLEKNINMCVKKYFYPAFILKSFELFSTKSNKICKVVEEAQSLSSLIFTIRGNRIEYPLAVCVVDTLNSFPSISHICVLKKINQPKNFKYRNTFLDLCK